MLRNRIPPPLVAALIALAMWGLARTTPVVAVPAAARIAVPVALALLGAAVCIAGVLAFRRASTTVNPLKPETASTLVHSGIFRFSRNPMYLGFALFLAAWAVFLASPWATLGVVGFVLYMNRFQIEPEERALAALFSEEFEAYRARVRRWV